MLNKRDLRLVFFAGCLALTWAGCGGGGTDSTSTTGVTGTVQAGEATVKSLATVPTADLTSYDKSTSTSSSSSISVPKSVTKGLGGDIGAVGSPSRAGCESNTHKKEMVRHSLAVALQRCYPEAMEQAGLITIPVGSFAHYSIVPPKTSATQQTGFCDDIPAEDTERKKACEADQAEGGSASLAAPPKRTRST